MMEKYKTLEGAIARIRELVDNSSAPVYEIHLDTWRNKYSEVDLIITDRGPVESHDMLYDGQTIEVTITTRLFKDTESRARFE